MLVKGVLLLYCFNSLLHQLLKFFTIAAFLFLDNACLHSQELRKYYWALGLVLFGHLVEVSGGCLFGLVFHLLVAHFLSQLFGYVLNLE